jgi:hypothetical protein
VAETKKKKRKTQEDLRAELSQLAKPQGDAKPPVDFRKTIVRVGGALAVLWVLAAGLGSWQRASWPFWVAAGLTVAVLGVGAWAYRFMKRQEALGALLRGADTEEGRREALSKLETGFKKGDVQALIARAQLEMQEEPRKALATLESVDLGRQMQAVADQVRTMRAMIHLTLGEAPEARALVDAIDLGKQQEAKVRAMTAAIAGEAWGRTGAARKGVEMLELFNPDDPALAEMRIQLLRARAFAYAGASDMKGAGRALRKLAETSPQLLMMFVGQKRIHPLLEKEAKDLLMKSGAVPRRMVQKRV